MSSNGPWYGHCRMTLFSSPKRRGERSGRNIFFDIFRFDDGLVVEHWAFSTTMEATPNLSGHTQLDGPTQAKHTEDTQKNKSLLRTYYEAFHIRGDHSGGDRYFADDLIIRHEPGVRDRVAKFLRDVEVLMQHRTIDEIRFLLGQEISYVSPRRALMKAEDACTPTCTACRMTNCGALGLFRDGATSGAMQEQ